MTYLTVQEIQSVGPISCEGRLDALMEVVLNLETLDDLITDPDLAADLGTGRVEIRLIVDAKHPTMAMIKAVAELSAVIAAVSNAAPVC
jgi:hypothetical protein